MKTIALSLVGVGLLFVSTVSAQEPQRGVFHPGEIARGFVYPGAKSLGQGREAQLGYQATFTTPDEIGKVVDWYREKVSPGLLPKPTESVKYIDGTVSSWPDVVCILEDSRQPAAKQGIEGDPRPVSVLLCMRRTADFTVSVVVTRAKGEGVTHIALAVLQHLKG
jgi:hypothetical protein